MQHRTGQRRTNCKLNCFYCRNIIQEESTRNCTWRKNAYSKFCMTFLSLHSWFPYGLIHNPAKTHLQNYLEHLFFLALYHFGRLFWKFSALMSKSLLISSLCLFVVNSYLSIPGSLNVKCSGASVCSTFFPVSTLCTSTVSADFSQLPKILSPFRISSSAVR